MSALPLQRSATSRPAVAPAPKKKPDLRVVPPAEPVARESIIGRVGITLLVLLFVAVFGLVVFQAVLAQSQRQLDDIRRDLASQELQAKALRLQLASAESPDRVLEAARTRLDMIPPGDVVYLEPLPGDDAKAAYDPKSEPKPTTSTTAKPLAPPTTQAKAPAKPVQATTPTTKAKQVQATTPTTKAKTSPTTGVGTR